MRPGLESSRLQALLEPARQQAFSALVSGEPCELRYHDGALLNYSDDELPVSRVRLGLRHRQGYDEFFQEHLQRRGDLGCICRVSPEITASIEFFHQPIVEWSPLCDARKPTPEQGKMRCLMRELPDEHGHTLL